VEITTNGHGTVKVSGLDADNKASLNTVCQVTVTPNTGYKVSSVNVNGTDITKTLAFTPDDADTNYIVNATFVADVTSGQTLVKLTGATGLEVGKTMQLTATVYGPDTSLVYTSSDATIATVDSNGVVTGVKAGFVTVTATSVLSTEDNPVYDTHTFFVEPSYIARMVEGFASYEYANGVNFSGSLAIAFGPGSVAEPDSAQLSLPYSFTIKKNAKATTLLSAYNFNLSLSFDSSTKMVLYVLASLLKIPTLSSSDNIDISYLGDGTLKIRGTTNVTTGTDEQAVTTKEVCFYKEVEIATLLSGLVSKLLPMIPSGTASTSGIDLSSLGIGSIASILPMLNQLLVFDTDAEKGISVAPVIVTTLQTYLTKYLKSLQESEDEDKSSQGTLLAALLPTNLQDIRFPVSLNEDKSFKSLNLVFKDSKDVTDSSTGTNTPVTYKWLSFTLGKDATAVDADYFTGLETSYASAEADSIILANVDTLKTSVKTDLTNSTLLNGSKTAHSVYNCIHYNNNLTTDLTSYRDLVTALTDTTSENYITNEKMIPTDLNSYLPYSSFDVVKTDDTKNVLPDEYTVKVGDTFKITNYQVVGDSTYASLETKPDFTDMKLGSNAVKTVTNADKTVTTTTYVSYDKDTQTVTIEALPEKEINVTLRTVIPTDYKGKYTYLTYYFNLPAAPVTSAE